MKQHFTLSLLALLFVSPLFSQIEPPTLDYYLPSDVTYNPNIPEPQEILGWVPGTWHVSHDKLASYMRTLAESSDRISIEDRGQTYEGRPLLLLTITSPENQQNLEEIRQKHVALTENGAESLDLESMPIVTYQGMSIHGNEPSGANAGLLVAYYLAAAEGPEIEQLLQHTVILLIPLLTQMVYSALHTGQIQIKVKISIQTLKTVNTTRHGLAGVRTITGLT